MNTVKEHNGKNRPAVPMSDKVMVTYACRYNLDHWHVPVPVTLVRWGWGNEALKIKDTPGDVMLYRVIG
jgi:hypothetical protein